MAQMKRGSGFNKLTEFLADIAAGQLKINQLAQLAAQDAKLAKSIIDRVNKRNKRAVERGAQEIAMLKDRVTRKFSVKGKAGAGRRAELAQALSWLTSELSTAKGLEAMTRRTADRVGIKYTTLKDSMANINRMFSMVGKLEQYLSSIYGAAAAFASDKVVQTVLEMVQQDMLDLQAEEDELEMAVKLIGDAMAAEEETVKLPGGRTFRLKDKL